VIVRRGRILSVIDLAELELTITKCRRCPRLVEWRELVAREKRAAFRDWNYWGRPVPGFGDPAASVYVLGLAPAAHGGNRTGRVFTGDRSGDWLFASLHRTGFANQPTSVTADDGLELTGLFVAAAVRCAPPANKPLPSERDNCLPYAGDELELLPDVKALVCLGSFAWDAALKLMQIRPKPKFGHGAEHPLADGPTLIGCYHPSQQNTFTGKLTEQMLDDVFTRASSQQSAVSNPQGRGSDLRTAYRGLRTVIRTRVPRGRSASRRVARG
jgi:uracil-DNA glycosylase